MRRAYIMIGCPGSGKSTWVKEHRLAYVSRDQVRSQLGYCGEGEKYLGTIQEEEEVTKECDRQRKELIQKGVDFAVDDTNIRKLRRESLIMELRSFGYHVVGVKMTTDLDTCLKRRKGEVPEGAIIRMHRFSEDVNPLEFDEYIEI